MADCYEKAEADHALAAVANRGAATGCESAKLRPNELRTKEPTYGICR